MMAVIVIEKINGVYAFFRESTLELQAFVRFWVSHVSKEFIMV